MNIAVAALVPIAALTLAASAQAASPIAAVQAWTRPAAAGGNAAGYLTLVNPGPADLLVGAASTLAERVELHTASMAGGIMRMGPEVATPLPAHGRTSFTPGGRHLMLVGLKRPLRLGERAPATLRFKSGARLKVEFVVVAGAPAEMAGPMPGMR